MGLKEGYIPVNQERYEQLLDCETRLQVVCDMLEKHLTINAVDLAVMLGSSKLAKKLEDEDKRFWDERLKEITKGDRDEIKDIDA